LNVATHLDDVPYDKLLQEKGFRGYPSLAFMDAEGNVIGQPSDRTVAAFANTRDALVKVDAVRERADAGDQAAAVELLFLNFSLGTIEADALEAGVATLAEHATREQLAEAKQIGLDGRIYEMYASSFQDEDSDAPAKMLVLLEAGQLPTPGSRACTGFWSTLGEHARVSGDAKLLRRVAKGMRSDMSSDTRSMEQAGAYEETALGLDKRDALVARQTAGETKLEAQILLIEARLEAVDLDTFRERLAAAMAVATAEQKTELSQANVDLEVKDLMNSYWGGGDREAIHLRVIALLETNDPMPSADLEGLLRAPIYYYTRSITDPKVLDAHAAAISKRYGPDSPAQALVEMITEAAAELRKPE
jgi:hypothetical protein